VLAEAAGDAVGQAAGREFTTMVIGLGWATCPAARTIDGAASAKAGSPAGCGASF
jgi:hypothetical protein